MAELLSSVGLTNFDLLALGVAIASTGILALVVFLQNPRSATNLAFLFFAVVAIIHGILNYLSYQIADPNITLWLIRSVIFFAVWYSFALMHLFYVFPLTNVVYHKLYWTALAPSVCMVSLLTLTPYVFSSLERHGVAGEVSIPKTGALTFVFVAAVVILLVSALTILLYKTLRAKGIQKNQFIFVSMGTILTLFLITVFVLIFPAFLHDVTFVPHTALFVLPFVAFTAYAIGKYKLLNVKVITTEIFSFTLSVVTFSQVIFAKSLFEKVFSIVIFSLVLIFSILLIRSVFREVKQREQIQVLADRLEKANVRLKELDTLKSQFLSLATHELRAPLTIVRNFISLVMEGAYGKLPVAAEEGLQKVFERATEMTHSIDNYLNVSRIEQGRMKYDFSDVDIVAMVKSAFEAHKPEAEKKGLKYTMSLAVNAVMVKIDKEKINEVLNNLIDNAIKYTPEGNVYISVESSNGKFKFSVKDSGVGMSKDTIDTKLFKLFSTAANSKSINMSSTGIGLFVSKSHVEACGGKIWAESEGEGKGSTFIVEFPIAIISKSLI